jgi:hypothetical protein
MDAFKHGDWRSILRRTIEVTHEGRTYCSVRRIRDLRQSGERGRDN